MSSLSPLKGPKLIGKGQGERDIFKATEGPGPNQYNSISSDNFLYQKPIPVCVISSAPTKRLLDTIVQDSIRNGVPGPAAYTVKPSLEVELQKSKNHSTFSSS